MENTPEKTVSEINTTGKILAGIILIIFLLFPICLILAYWPSSIPNPADKVKMKPLYIDEPYHIRLACIPDSVCCIEKIWAMDTMYFQNQTDALDLLKKADSINKRKIDSLKSLSSSADSILIKLKIDSINNLLAQSGKSEKLLTSPPCYYTKYALIDFSTLLLILVAAAGFLGNMIHIATSFTTFVGNGDFKRSWLLWYFVKPFTASGLALGLYFVFRGGFLNYTADETNINLYGILTVSILAGLFTDKATLKLGEIFGVVFGLKGEDKRTDKLTNTDIKILSIVPDKLVANAVNTITIKGENLDKVKFTFKINAEAITADKVTIAPAAITILYTIPETQRDKTSFQLQVLDEKGKEFFSKAFPV